MNSIKREIKKRLMIDTLLLDTGNLFKLAPQNIVKTLRDRAFPEGAFQIKRHPEHIRYALLASLFFHRRMEVTDNIVNIFLHLIRLIEKKADHSMEQRLIKKFQTVYGSANSYKMQRPLLMIPKGVFRVLFPVVGKMFYTNYEEFEVKVGL